MSTRESIPPHLDPRQTGFDWAPPKKSKPTSFEPPFDVCASKHHGNKQSTKANAKAADYKAVMRTRILDFVRACKERGTTSAEIEKLFGIAKNKFSGRITSLKADGLIFDSGREQDGCAVLVAKREWVNGSERL